MDNVATSANDFQSQTVSQPEDFVFTSHKQQQQPHKQQQQQRQQQQLQQHLYDQQHRKCDHHHQYHQGLSSWLLKTSFQPSDSSSSRGCYSRLKSKLCSFHGYSVTNKASNQVLAGLFILFLASASICEARVVLGMGVPKLELSRTRRSADAQNDDVSNNSPSSSASLVSSSSSSSSSVNPQTSLSSHSLRSIPSTVNSPSSFNPSSPSSSSSSSSPSLSPLLSSPSSTSNIPDASLWPWDDADSSHFIPASASRSEVLSILMEALERLDVISQPDNSSCLRVGKIVRDPSSSAPSSSTSSPSADGHEQEETEFSVHLTFQQSHNGIDTSSKSDTASPPSSANKQTSSGSAGDRLSCVSDPVIQIPPSPDNGGTGNDDTGNGTLVIPNSETDKDKDDPSGVYSLLKSGKLSRTQIVVISTCSAIIGMFFLVAAFLRIRNYIKRIQTERALARRPKFRSCSVALRNPSQSMEQLRRDSLTSKCSHQNSVTTKGSNCSQANMSSRENSSSSSPRHDPDTTPLLVITRPPNDQQVETPTESHSSLQYIDEDTSTPKKKQCPLAALQSKPPQSDYRPTRAAQDLNRSASLHGTTRHGRGNKQNGQVMSGKHDCEGAVNPSFSSGSISAHAAAAGKGHGNDSSYGSRRKSLPDSLSSGPSRGDKAQPKGYQYQLVRNIDLDGISRSEPRIQAQRGSGKRRHNGAPPGSSELRTGRSEGQIQKSAQSAHSKRNGPQKQVPVIPASHRERKAAPNAYYHQQPPHNQGGQHYNPIPTNGDWSAQHAQMQQPQHQHHHHHHHQQQQLQQQQQHLDQEKLPFPAESGFGFCQSDSSLSSECNQVHVFTGHTQLEYCPPVTCDHSPPYDIQIQAEENNPVPYAMLGAESPDSFTNESENSGGIETMGNTVGAGQSNEDSPDVKQQNGLDKLSHNTMNSDSLVTDDIQETSMDACPKVNHLDHVLSNSLSDTVSSETAGHNLTENSFPAHKKGLELSIYQPAAETSKQSLNRLTPEHSRGSVTGENARETFTKLPVGNPVPSTSFQADEQELPLKSSEDSVNPVAFCDETDSILRANVSTFPLL